MRARVDGVWLELCAACTRGVAERSGQRPVGAGTSANCNLCCKSAPRAVFLQARDPAAC